MVKIKRPHKLTTAETAHDVIFELQLLNGYIVGKIDGLGLKTLSSRLG